jgi:hypothetical protein
MNDMKRQFIRSLLLAQSAINDEEHEDNGYFTYFTNIGVVIGKKKDFIISNYESEDEFAKGIAEQSKQNDGISIYELGHSYFQFMNKKLNDKYDSNNTDSKALVLEDVTIKDLNNNVIRTDTFVLFTDQITGLLPGRDKNFI